jgi:hypothetical protein
MVAVSKDKDLADKLKVQQKVAKEFVQKDEEEGLWQEAPELDVESLEAVSFEDKSILELIPEDAWNPEVSEPPFRLEDRFVKADNDPT